MSERKSIKLCVCLAVCILWLGNVRAVSAAKPDPSNRAPLRAQPYKRLPMGSVKAKTWLLHQLLLQNEGLTGHAEELYDDIGNSDWVTGQDRGGQFAWERGPYYAKGLVALAYVLDDPELQDQGQEMDRRPDQ